MCLACGLDVEGDFCHFCRRTIDLIKADRCVSCTKPLDPLGTIRREGRCDECRSRNHELSQATRHLLILASKARYRERLRVAA